MLRHDKVISTTSVHSNHQSPHLSLKLSLKNAPALAYAHCTGPSFVSLRNGSRNSRLIQDCSRKRVRFLFFKKIFQLEKKSFLRKWQNRNVQSILLGLSYIYGSKFTARKNNTK